MLLRTLARLGLPSWAFFDVIGDRPELEARPCPPHGAPGAWTPLVRPRPRGATAVLGNPDGLATLAAQTLVERWHLALVGEVPDPVAAALVERLVEALVPSAWRTTGWQYRLVVHDGAEVHVCWTSPVRSAA